MQLHLGGQRVQGALFQAWSRQQVLARSAQDIAPAAVTPAGPYSHAEAAAAADASTTQALDAVLSELNGAFPGQRARLSVLLDDTRVHVDVVPGDYGTCSERQLQAIANACVNELISESAVTHVVRYQLQPDERHLLICAIAKHDIELVLQVASQHRMSVASMRPEFFLKWNRHAHLMGEQPGVFASTSGSHAIVACARRNAITAVSSGSWPALVPPAFSEAEPIDSHHLDDRVDRLLASVGQDAHDLTHYVLVAHGASTQRLGPRWVRLDWDWEAA